MAGAMKRVSLGLSLALLFPASALGQIAPELPAQSPRARVEQRVGLTDLWVDYGSPAVRGREIWGALVPYGELWRAGANLNTRVHFSRDAQVGDVEVPAGTHGLFAIPGSETWTVVLNRRSDAWGTGGYDPSLDVARIEVPVAEAPHRERLTFSFSDTTLQETRLDLEWAGVRVSVPIAVDTDRHVEAEIAAATGRAWIPHERAARYLLDQGKDLERALRYAEQSVAIDANWRNLWVEARLLAELGRKRDAVKTAKRAKQLGDGSPAFEFHAPQMDEAIARWKGKS